MSLFYYALLFVHSSFAIILKRKRKLFALLLLSYRCIVTINVCGSSSRWVGLQCVIIPDYLEVATAVVVQNFSPYIDIVLMFSYSGPSEILGSDGEQNID